MLKRLFPVLLSLCLFGCGTPKKSCDYPLFESAWNKITENYAEPVTGERLFSGALKVTENEVGKNVPVPKYARDSHYTPSGFWRYHFEMTGKLPSSNACYSMIKGMVVSLQSRHSYYLKPAERLLSEEIANELGGVGFFLFKKGPSQPALIYKVFGNSNAAINGIEPGDEILKIDGGPVTDLYDGQVAYLLRGKIGSLLELTIKKTNSSVKVVDLEREKRDQAAYCENTGAGIPYCAITTFSAKNIAEIFAEELHKKTGYDQKQILILDLRYNHGGFVDEAHHVAELWLGKKVFATTKTRSELKTYQGSRKPLGVKKIVILANDDTASASEMLAMALRDYNLAIIIGVKTYGKGEIQYTFTLKDKSRLVLVSGYWFPPDGKNINYIGIPPDYEVSLTAQDLKNKRDPQMEVAIELIKQ